MSKKAKISGYRAIMLHCTTKNKPASYNADSGLPLDTSAEKVHVGEDSALLGLEAAKLGVGTGVVGEEEVTKAETGMVGEEG